MMRYIIVFVLLASCLFQSPVAADVTARDIENALSGIPEHPYLYFTEGGKRAILDRIESDPECKGIMDRLFAEGNRLLYTPVNTEPPAQDSRAGFVRSDERLSYLRENRGNALKLSFLYQMTGDGCYVRKAFEFADAVCDLPTWVDRRHQFTVIYSRVWPWNVPDDQAAFGVDIETTETARILAAIYDWLYPALSIRERDRIRGAMLEKAILRVRGNYEYHWWATSYRCNWCACCNGGLGAAALALLTEDPRLTDVVAESFNRISKQFDEIGMDGGWQEGCGYYRKGIHAMNFFADPLKRLSNGQFNLYDHRNLQENPITFLLYNTITPRRLIPFEDSSYNRAGTSHIWNKLAEETKSGETAWFRDYMWGEGRDIFDIIWPRASVAPKLPGETSKHFRTIDWAVMRSSFTDPDKVVIACKAGKHDDPHHGHLDCGHFIVYWRNQEYICDIGSPEYDELYFDEIRWEYPQASSIGHNVVLVNGELQIPAKRKNTSWKEGIGGEILDFRSGADLDYTLMDLTGAYPGNELKGWRRHIILDKPNITVVLDEIESAAGVEIEARFHSQCAADIGEGYVFLKGDEGAMVLAPAVDGSYTFREGKHPSLPVIENARFEWIPYFGVVTTAESGRTLAAAVILPVKDGAEAGEVARSLKKESDADGGVGVSFRASGKRHSYRFMRGANGLVYSTGE